jgi:inner membrane protein
MPTVGHVAIGFAAGRAQARSRRDLWKQLALFGALGVAPDLDVVPALLHHPWLVPLGHRGATHSLTFALALGLLVALFAPGASRWRTALAAFLTVASHGLVDPLNTSSIGTAYFWPLSSERFSWGVHFIPETPVGWGAFYGVGLRHLGAELLIFSPFLAYALWPRARRATPHVLRLPDPAARRVRNELHAKAPLELDGAEERTWGVSQRSVYVIYGEHDGESFQPSDRVLPSWSPEEDSLADAGKGGS